MTIVIVCCGARADEVLAVVEHLRMQVKSAGGRVYSEFEGRLVGMVHGRSGIRVSLVCAVELNSPSQEEEARRN